MQDSAYSDIDSAVSDVNGVKLHAGRLLKLSLDLP